ENHHLLTESAMEKVFTPVRTSTGTELPYGLGWFVQKIGGVTVAWHYGYVPDISSSLLVLVPERRLAFIALANSDGLSASYDEKRETGALTASDPARAFLTAYGILSP